MSDKMWAWLVLFISSVMSDSLWPHGLQHAKLPCSPISPGICSNLCPLRWWCNLTISFSVISSSSFPQSFPASGSFPMSWLFTTGGQNIGASASASVLAINIQGRFPLGLIGFISLLSVDSQESSPAPCLKATILQCSIFFMVQLSCPYMTPGETIALTIGTFVGKVISVLFDMLGLS